MRSKEYNSRRAFIINSAIGSVAFIVAPQFVIGEGTMDAEPLLDWSQWQRYRTKISHPALTIKKKDLDNARENIKRYRWAKNYAQNIDKNAAYSRRYLV